MRRFTFALALLLAGCGPAVAPASLVASPSPLASTVVGHAPARTFSVGTRTLSLHRGERPLSTTVYYPKNAPGPFPVVVFGHGFGGTPTAYAALLKRWAAAGFVVAAPAFPRTAWGVAKPDLLDVVNQPADVGAVLSGLESLPASDALRKILDPSRAAVAGHSAGAITALGVFTDDGRRSATNASPPGSSSPATPSASAPRSPAPPRRCCSSMPPTTRSCRTGPGSGRTTPCRGRGRC